MLQYFPSLLHFLYLLPGARRHWVSSGLGTQLRVGPGPRQGVAAPLGWVRGLTWCGDSDPIGVGWRFHLARRVVDPFRYGGSTGVRWRSHLVRCPAVTGGRSSLLGQRGRGLTLAAVCGLLDWRLVQEAEPDSSNLVTAALVWSKWLIPGSSVVVVHYLAQVYQYPTPIWLPSLLVVKSRQLGAFAGWSNFFHNDF